MALIYADDFGGIGLQNVGGGGIFASFNNDATTMLAIQRLVNGYGFDLPAYQNLGGNSWMNTVNYDLNKKALLINMYQQASYTFSPGAIGLQRTFNYSGDTVRFGFLAALSTLYMPRGPFVTFEDLYTVGVDFTTGNYMINDVVTSTPAQLGIDTPMYHEVVFTPTTMELWISKTKIAEVSRSAIPVRRIRFGQAGTSTLNLFGLTLYNLIVVDNTGTFKGPIGRMGVKTYQATAQGTIQSANVPSNYTALQIINKIADGKDVETGSYILGVLASPNGYVTNAFTSTYNGRLPLAACVNIQARRKSPAADGLAPYPYIKIGATKVSATPQPVSSLWNVFCTEIPMVPSQTFTAFEFGYDQDFLDVERVFISNRDGVAIYGNQSVTPAISGPAFLSKVPTLGQTNIANTTVNAYVTDYSKSTLQIGLTSVENITYRQEQ
jgi:hypothetical protein